MHWLSLNASECMAPQLNNDYVFIPYLENIFCELITFQDPPKCKYY